MSVSWLEIFGSLVIIIGGIFYTIRLVNGYRTGRKIWKTYSVISEKTELKTKRSLNLLSDWPNLFGRIDEKRVYVHPDRGKRKYPSKTIFAVESNIDISTEVIISISDTDMPEETHELEIKNINKYNYKIYAKDEIDENLVEKLFSGDTARKTKDLIERNKENFRALILEPGLVMFSTFEIDLDEENMSENVEALCDVVDDIEENAPKSNEHLENPRMMQLSKGSRSGLFKGLIPLVLFGIGGYLINQVMQDFSLFFLNTAVILVLVGIVKLFVSFYNEWKYQ
ncbi:MAG: hypothetical protein V5A66_01930 [Candidatus Thermoplasmatota archaeon]